MELLRSENYEALGRKLTEAAPDELAAFFAELNEEQFKAACRGFDSGDTADFLTRLDDAALIERIIGVLKDSELKEVMDEMSVDETLEIIEDMPTEVVRRIAEKEEILRLLEERNFKVLKPLLNEFNAIDLEIGRAHV